MIHNLNVWKKLAKLSWVLCIIILIIKTLFRDIYGEFMMYFTTAIGILSILILAISEFILYINRKKL